MNSIARFATNRGMAGPLFCFLAFLAAPAFAVPVIVADNGFGTAQMPILAAYTGETDMQIVDGLPGGTTIDIDAILMTPAAAQEIAGGILGGTKSGGGGGTLFNWTMTGTGLLPGFNRIINMPSSGSVLSFPANPPLDSQGSFEVHAEPRTNNAPLQTFDTVMFRMFSQITGDPDFDLLRLVAGTDFGLPSPGHTTLLQNGANWEVDSFFDITYRIDFVGRPGGQLAGMSGSTTGTVRFSLGDPIPIVPEPASAALTAIGAIALATLIRRRAPQQHE